MLSRAEERTRLGVVCVMATGLAVTSHYTGYIGPAILGASAAPAFWFWQRVFLVGKPDPAAVIPPFLLAVAAFQLHSVEEYYGHYGPAIARLFDFGWTDERFVAAILLLSAGLSCAVIGLYRRLPIAGFAASLFLFSRFAELLLFLFPFLRPSVHPEIRHTISAAVSSGTFVTGMPVYWVKVHGLYYFPGLITLPLVLLTAASATRRIWAAGSLIQT